MEETLLRVLCVPIVAKIRRLLKSVSPYKLLQIELAIARIETLDSLYIVLQLITLKNIAMNTKVSIIIWLVICHRLYYISLPVYIIQYIMECSGKTAGRL